MWRPRQDYDRFGADAAGVIACATTASRQANQGRVHKGSLRIPPVLTAADAKTDG